MGIAEIVKATLAELPQNLTRYEAATFLRKHVRTLDRLIAQGAIRAVKIGGSVLVPKSEIARVLAGADHA